MPFCPRAHGHRRAAVLRTERIVWGVFVREAFTAPQVV
jgi:hypothetical protein